MAPPLVVRFGAMGDMVMLTALLRTVHRRFDSPVDLLMAEGPYRPFLEGQPWVGKVLAVRTRKLPVWLNLQMHVIERQLRGRGPGPVWICQVDDLSHSLVRRAGYTADWIVSRRDFPDQAGVRMVDRLQDMGNATPQAIATPPPATERLLPRIIARSAWLEDARTWLERRGLAGRPLILIQAGNKRTMFPGSRQRERNTKYWPEVRWAAVIDRLHDAMPEAALLLMGVPMERALNRAILGHVRSPAAIDVAGEVPVTRLMGLASLASGMVSVDTGPAHIAGTLSCPLVVLFGAHDPLVFTPTGDDARVEVVAGDRHASRPMLTITVEDVMVAWQRLQTRALPDGVGPNVGPPESGSPATSSLTTAGND